MRSINKVETNFCNFTLLQARGHGAGLAPLVLKAADERLDLLGVGPELLLHIGHSGPGWETLW
jgi:hypothetical protein